MNRIWQTISASPIQLSFQPATIQNDRADFLNGNARGIQIRDIEPFKQRFLPLDFLLALRQRSVLAVRAALLADEMQLRRG